MPFPYEISADLRKNLIYLLDYTVLYKCQCGYGDPVAEDMTISRTYLVWRLNWGVDLSVF